MSRTACPSCQALHGARARYCLRCGARVGERPIGVEELVAVAAGRDAARPAKPVVDDATVAVPAAAPARAAAPVPFSVWRRPGASALVASALALGVVGGFLLGPDGGAARRAPVVLGQVAAAAPGAGVPATSAAPATTAAPPATQGAVDLAPAATSKATNTATGAKEAAAAGAPGPAAGDAITTPVAPAPAATTTPSTGAGAAPTKTDTTGTTPAKRKPKAKPAPAAAPAHAASTLPPIDHVWVIALAGALPERDGSYLGDVLRTRGTLLPGYAPGAADPLAGGQALVGGGAPTLAGQLAAQDLVVKAYADSADACARNPFAAAGTAAGDAATCASLAQLDADLGPDGSVPAFSYILPDPALDADALDALLEHVIAPIRRLDAYRSGGLIAIVPTAAGAADPTAATGALLLSPFAAPSTSVDGAAGPGTLLRTFEDLFGADPLGAAAAGGVTALGPEVLAPRRS